MSDFISKPIDLGRLAALLVKWLPRAVESPMAGRGDASAAADGQKGQASSFDFLLLQRRLGGGHDRAGRVLVAFLEDFETWIEEADLALRASDERRLRELVHSLKGAASGVGAARILQSSAALDNELRSQSDGFNRQKVGILLATLSAELAEAIQELKSSAWIAAPASETHN